MIITAEHLTDPVAYTLQNVVTDVNVQNSLNAAGYTIVSGADYDVLIERLTGEPLTVGRKDFIVSRLLGNLYTGGEALGLPYEADNLELTWYPSPAHANGITEKLGMVAGRDVLRFVHAESDEVSSTRYRAYLANGEYPQSMGIKYFIHDRNYDHAVAVLTMPPTVTKHIIDTISPLTDKDIVKADKSIHGKSFVSIFDGGTAGMRRIAELVLFDERGFDAMESLDYYSLTHAYELLPHETKVRYKKLAESKRTALMQYIDYYRQELLPKVAALQAVTPTLINRMGVVELTS